MQDTPTPYPYQRVAVKAAADALRTVMRALVVMATGLGKTFTAAFIAQEVGAKRILFLVHNNFILKHALGEFRQVFGQEIKMATYNGMSQEGAHEAEIVFATWQTMSKKLKRWKRNHFDLIIVDEAHHSEADTYRPVTEYFTGPKLGITATPDRSDDADIRDVFGPEVVNITLEEAIAQKWLPRIEYHVVTDESLDEKALQQIAAEIREGKKRFTMAEVNRRIFIRKRDKEIARIINGYNEKAVVFCANIPHADRMAQSLVLGTTFHSKKGKSQSDSWDKNQQALDDLKNGVVRRVTAVNAFNEGVNVPSVGLVVFCRVTGSLTIFRQQLGRGLRPGKEKLIVLDFVGNLEHIQLVREMMNRVADYHERLTSKEERDREGYSRKPLEVSGAGFEFTFSNQIVDLMEILKHTARELYPTWQEASEAAKKLGITTWRMYVKRFSEDVRLPSTPAGIYPDFPGFPVFLGKKSTNPLYKTWQKAAKAAKKLGISKREEYMKLYKEDSRLPPNPVRHYSDLSGWYEFFHGYVREFYPTWQEAAAVARKLGLVSLKNYKKNCGKDPRLPKNLVGHYKELPNLKIFFGRRPYYGSWQQASKAARKLGITTSTEYVSQKRYKEDKCLPSEPWEKYPDFPGWPKFLGRVK